MDYYNMMNVASDTKMRENIADSAMPKNQKQEDK